MFGKFPQTQTWPYRTIALHAAIIVILGFALPGTAGAVPPPSSKLQVGGVIGDGSVDTNLKDDSKESATEGTEEANASSAPVTPPRYSYIWVPVSEFSGCGTNLGSGSTWSCTPHPDSCEAGNGSRFAGEGDALQIGANTGTAEPVEGVTQRGIRVDNEGGEDVDLGIRCALPGTPEFAEAPPVVITVTREDFARLPVKPLAAHAGPVDGWLPVNMVNILHTDPETQELSTELLDTPVAIRATPISYHWDLGDGNTITTTNPGKPYPAETISATYTQEGWYDTTLTTTFSGQFSVNGGEWQDIDGTIEIASDPVPLYSKSLESRLVNGDLPVDEDEDPWIPERSPDTEGPQDPDASHRTL